VGVSNIDAEIALMLWKIFSFAKIRNQPRHSLTAVRPFKTHFT
jgi:hypothetical protein